MGRVHKLLEEHGKQVAIEMDAAPRDVIETAARYLSEEDNALAFAYSGWAQCALPHRRVAPGEVWEVASERMRLVVEPGRRPSGKDGLGPLEQVSVPFGSYARLILLYLQTEALKTGSPEVELGRSWRDWMARIGVPWGGKSGRGVREQAELLSRCRLTFHLVGQGRAGLVNSAIVDRALFMDDGEDRQGRLNLETARLSQTFFEQLRKHPIPLEEGAIKALSNNSAALDCYVWLAYRLHSLEKPRLVTWTALKAQHGQGFKQLYHFKSKFPGILGMATAVYPTADIEVKEEGVLLKPSKPPVPPRLVTSR
ncbi:replication protein RepA [Roseomonas sp. NAR14]|uniref:Replication protein RepA n=1 Tax=Roseomonas acroporae TaxID=2937791 RepID=A0A9X1YFG2_9PROT|nr:replication protein RepA [Roseomonas acroporae]MCK8788150.1 replication protein RepA [Roseomonas acroporae]